MAKIKKLDFVEIEYTGKVKETGEVFDTTNLEEAKKGEIFNPKVVYGPIVICVGEGQLLKGLDDAIEGKDIGSYEVEIDAENAFGKKDAKLLKIIPLKIFAQQNVRPVPGLTVNVDNAMGIVKIASGGRIIVDFNHPLSGKEIVYNIKINKLVEDNNEKIKSFMNLVLGVKKEEVGVEIKEGKATITLVNEMPKELADKLAEDLARTTKLKVVFKAKKEEKKPADKK